MAYAHPEFLVEPPWLDEHKIDDGLLIVDCPWEPAAYRRAHLPGAVFLNEHPFIKAKDKNENPTLYISGPEEFSRQMTALGIGPDTAVVIYDDIGSIFAARLWWALRYYGHTNVRILNGGWQGWVGAGLMISYRTHDPRPAKIPFRAQPDPSRLARLGEVMKIHRSGDWQMVDPRSDAEWEGKITQGNKRVGRLPEAKHLEWNTFLMNSTDAEDIRRFKPSHDMLKLCEVAGLKADKGSVTYCQTGVRAAFMAFSLELIGFPTPKVYDGSMAEWANLPDTPLKK